MTMHKSHLLVLLGILLAACTASSPPEPTPLPPEPILYEAPAWFADATLYLVYVRSFADSDGDGVGDLRGVASRLDYIQSLGADTLWLMPIFPSPTDHGYDVTDFTAINPEFGTLEDLQFLVREAHARAMRVLLDFVPSHLSNQHPIFQDAYNNPESLYSEWFVFTNETQTRYAGFADLSEMPRFNHYNLEVVQYLTDAALFWLDLDGDGDYTDGVDGFRIDNATFPPQEFFYAFRQSLKAANPEALLLGETWVTTASDLSRYFVDQFDALFDFPLYSLLQGNQNFNLDGLLAGKSSPALLTVLFQDQARRFPPEGIPVRFVSNHDTNRVATKLGGDLERQKMAISFLAALPGVPMVYYGEELGMPGQKGGPPFWDNYRREPMDWYAAESGPGQTSWFRPDDRWNQPFDGISVEEQESDPQSLLNYYRLVLNLRKQHPAMIHGELEVLSLEVAAPGPWGMLRSGFGEQIVVLVNFSDAPQPVSIAAFPLESAELVDLLTGEVYPEAQPGAPYELTLPAKSILWLSTGE